MWLCSKAAGLVWFKQHKPSEEVSHALEMLTRSGEVEKVGWGAGSKNLDDGIDPGSGHRDFQAIAWIYSF